MTVSALVLTLNEEDNLRRCLDSLRWCEEVVVLDSHSEDGTVELAEELGARVLQRHFDDFATQRNHGLEHGGFESEWVLHVDADEVVPEPLRDEILRRVETSNRDAYRVASRMMFRGRWLRHAGLYPSYQVRLGRRDALRFRQVGHGQRETLPPDRIGTLEHDLLHHSFSKGLEDWFERHNRYSTAEALEEIRADATPTIPTGAILSDPVARRRWLKERVRRLPFRPTLRFLYMYVLRGGFLDGRRGLDYCRLLAVYEAMIVTKVRELRGRQDAV